MKKRSRRKVVQPPRPRRRLRELLPSRNVLVAIGAAIAAVAALSLWIAFRKQTPRFLVTPDQNILLITIDTLRGDALGSYGGRAATPHLDRLASDGIRFSFAHAHAVVTLPSHSSILTGMHPFEHGVRDNAGYRLDEAATTLAEAAKRQGYATGAFVGAFPLDRQFGLSQGFDVYDDVAQTQVAPADFAFAERRAAEVVSRAQAWISAQQGPWFAWVHVFDPHSPYEPPQPFAQEYASDLYAGEVAYTDSALGPLLELARANSRPTTIVVTADHGEGLGEHNEVTHGVFAYETTLHVPLIVTQVGPGATLGQGLVADAPVRHIDIAPTIAGLTGIDMGELPGRSLLDVFSERDDARLTYFEAMTAMLKRGWAPLRGVILGREKYIDLPIEEFYDLGSDPGEKNNLVPRAGEKVRRLASELKGLGLTMPGEQMDENAEVRARLQSLGYFTGSAPRKPKYTEDDDPKRLIDVDQLMIRGIELHRAGRGAEAIDAYRRVIVRRPDMELAYRRLAYIQWDAGATGAAISTLRETLARNGPDPDVEVKLATYLAETGDTTEAIPMLEKVLSAEPENADAMNALGISYARANRPDEAIAVFERILQSDPRNAYAYENLATVYLELRDMANARQAFEQAIAVAPASSRAHAGLGVVASQAGRIDDAIGYWRQAVQLDPRNFDAMFNLGTSLIRIGRAAEARPVVEQFVRTAPPGFYARDIARFRQWLSGG
ncbi:MAG TPA: tetratricopeptide repeat protein [Vicinamibacterales bacterium]